MLKSDMDIKQVIKEVEKHHSLAYVAVMHKFDMNEFDDLIAEIKQNILDAYTARGEVVIILTKKGIR